jgi:hypothetical protein
VDGRIKSGHDDRTILLSAAGLDPAIYGRASNIRTAAGN